MLSIRDTARSAMGRREWLRIGGLNTLGLSLPGFLAAQEQDTVGNTADPTFGRAKNVIYLYLGGGFRGAYSNQKGARLALELHSFRQEPRSRSRRRPPPGGCDAIHIFDALNDFCYSLKE